MLEIGTEMARQMKRSKPRVPVFLLTGTGGLPEPLTGADACLGKNDGLEQLLRLIKQLLGSEQRSQNPQLRSKGPIPPIQTLLIAAVEDSDDAILSTAMDGTN
jgi:hypothetical protein